MPAKTAHGTEYCMQPQKKPETGSHIRKTPERKCPELPGPAVTRILAKNATDPVPEAVAGPAAHTLPLYASARNAYRSRQYRLHS